MDGGEGGRFCGSRKDRLTFFVAKPDFGIGLGKLKVTCFIK